MNHSKIYGFALIFGAVGTTITMLFHPTGSDLLHENAEMAKRGAMIARATHSLALISYPILCFGFLGVYRQIGERQLLKSAALIAYFFGGVAVTIAATVSGLVSPSLTSQILNADELTRPVLHALLDYNFSLNQAFTKIFVVASSLSIILWSLSIWNKTKFAKIVGITGGTIGSISIVSFFAGHLRLDVHGFGLFAFAQAAWTILVGIFFLVKR